MVLRDSPVRLASSLIDTPRTKYSRRSSAHCSTPTNPFLLASIPTTEPRLNTPSDASATAQRRVRFRPAEGGQFSAGADRRRPRRPAPGETARSTRSRPVLQSVRTLGAEPSSSVGDAVGMAIQASSDLDIRHVRSRIEDHPRSLHLTSRRRHLPRATLNRRAGVDDRPPHADAFVMIVLRLLYTAAVMVVVFWLLRAGNRVGGLLFVPAAAVLLRREAESGRLVARVR